MDYISMLLLVILVIVVIFLFVMGFSDARRAHGRVVASQEYAERYYEVNEERIRCLTDLHNSLCDEVNLIEEHLGVKVVLTPLRREVVKVVKMPKEKSNV